MSELEEGEEWDFWEHELKLRCIAYTSEIDADLINVYKGIMAHKYNTEIASELKLPPQYVELLQEMFCSADWASYGTSPRGCWPNLDHNPEEQLAKLKAWYLRKWEEPIG